MLGTNFFNDCCEKYSENGSKMDQSVEFVLILKSSDRKFHESGIFASSGNRVVVILWGNR